MITCFVFITVAAAVDNREAWAKVQRLMEVKVAIQAEIRSDHLR